MIKIPLTKGYFATVDDDQAGLLNFKWYALVRKDGIVYAQRTKSIFDGGGSYLLHREVLGLKKSDPIVDHFDGNGLDCRKSNLRLSTKTKNNRNVVGPRTNNKSGFLGVHKNGNSFVAKIKVNKVIIYLGSHPTALLANAARLAGEKKHWGIEPRRAKAHM